MPFDQFWSATLPLLVGFAGMAFGTTWPLLRSRKAMLFMQLAGTAFFIGHYALLGAWTGALMNVLGALQVAAAVPLGSRPSFRIVYLLTVPVALGGVAMTWHGLPSAFAATGLLLVSLGRYQINVRLFRLFILMALPFWFGHNILVGSIPGMASDILGLATGSYSLFRTAPRHPAPLGTIAAKS